MQNIHIYIYYTQLSSMNIVVVLYRKTCHGAGAKVGWIKEYRGLTSTM